MKILVNVPIELTIEEGKSKLTEALRILNNIDSEVVSFEWDSQPNLRTDLILEHDIIEVTEEEEQTEEEQETYSPQEGEKFARKCDVTGEGMDEGYVVDELTYIKYKKDLIEHLRKLDWPTTVNWNGTGGTNPKDIKDEQELMEFFHNEEYYYWTSWIDQDDDEYIFTNGELVEIEQAEQDIENEALINRMNKASIPSVENEQANTREESDSLPSAMDYANYLHRACAKFKITISEARSKYGQLTYKEWSKLLVEQETKPLPTTWDFVEKYYPNYSSSDQICRALDLLLKKETEELSSEEDIEITYILEDVFEQAIANFIKINGGI